MINEEKIIRACILSIPGIGSQRLRHLIARFGNAYTAWTVPTDEAEIVNCEVWLKDFFHYRKTIHPEQMERTLKEESISLLAREEDYYPCLLAECPDAPSLLFYKGNIVKGAEGMAVVGARKATPYGKAAATFLAAEVAKAGYTVISGLARGIDTAAHKGALEAGGSTWAFLAGGLDNIYPPENLKLAQQILQNGALISEYPPGMASEPGQFPARNRLISGASRGVIVVEAAARSGALITVDFALEQGREVFAVPGPIFSEMSRGTHQLLRMGAKLVENKEDIITELVSDHGLLLNESNYDKIEVPECRAGACFKGNNPCEQEIMQNLTDVPLHIDRLISLCSFPPQEIALSLLEMQLAGKIVQLPGQYYVLQR